MMLSLVEGDMVKFAKDGSAITTAAIKLARAHTGRDRVALCGDHPFFSVHDWFMGTTEISAGIPQVVRDLTSTFPYGDIDALVSMLDERPNEFAAVILEPAKYEDPPAGYLHKVQDLCAERGIVFVLDEMITGFRWANGGAQAYYGIVPDLACFGKAMANGISVSALVGRREIMELGGLETERERVFLLSTTHGAETHALAGATAALKTYRDEPVIETLFARGSQLREGVESAIAWHGLERSLKLIGKPCCLVLQTLDGNGEPSQALRTLMLQEVIKRGLIMPSLIVSYSHTERDIDLTIEALDRAMHVYKKALLGGVEHYLVGRPSKVVYRKSN